MLKWPGNALCQRLKMIWTCITSTQSRPTCRSTFQSTFQEPIHGCTGCGAKQGYHSPDAHVPPKTTNLLEFFRTIQSIYIQFLRIHCMSYAALTRYLAEKAKGFSKHSLLAYLEHEREETDELFRTLQQQSITFYTTIIWNLQSWYH